MRFTMPALATALSLALAAPAMAEEFILDKSHTAITFTVDHLGFSLTHGKFTKYDAEINFDQEDPTKSTVNFTIQADSIDTGWEARDKHVRGPDFLNVDKHPEITFISTAVEKTGDDTATMTGDLTLNGTTKEVSFDVTMRKLAPSPFGKKLLTGGFFAETTLDRTDYGISYGAGAIGNEIPIRVDLEITKPE